jgi:hypothetical protein
MSNINRNLYQMLQQAANQEYSTIERTGDEGAVILRVTVNNRYEDWLIREFKAEQRAEAYLRSVGRVEKLQRIEEDKWYRPADKELAWDFDAGATIFLEQWFGVNTELLEEEQEEFPDNLTMPF